MKGRAGFYASFAKRAVDLSLAAVALVVTAVPQALIALAVKATSPGPVFFRQARVGRHGRLFRIVKFRTMTAGGPGRSPVTVAGSAWITPCGRFLRRWKLDELPQLWNVLKGEMSFVGPRPDVPGFADRLSGDERRLLQLRPGITGPASLQFADEEQRLAEVEDPERYNREVLFPAKVRINLHYLDNCSFRLDVKCLWDTLRLACGRRGQ
ncbi:MAG TPA: sugar transferase [Candidatus Aminicenantes bacterium]|nr:sugar transferase [Candidatus Aminicenantes bacterium]